MKTITTNRYSLKQPHVVREFIPQEKAEIAIELLRHLAFVAAEQDGEDSAGRQKARLLTPHEVAERAYGIADAAWNLFEEKGQLLKMPDPATLEEEKE